MLELVEQQAIDAGASGRSFISRGRIWKSWTTKTIFSGSSASTLRDGINAEVIAPINGKGTFSLYFSAFYAGEKEIVSPAEISEKIAEFNALEKADYDLKEEIEKNYAELSADQQAQVKGYNEFREKCLSFIRAEESREGVIAQTDEEYGQYQLKRYNCMTSYSPGMRHGDDRGIHADTVIRFLYADRYRIPSF